MRKSSFLFATVTALIAGPALAQMPGMTPVPAKPAAASADPMAGMDHSAHDMSAMEGMDDSGGMVMTGALGAYPMTREASGTSWQPDASRHDGVHAQKGDWSLMSHALLTAVYDHQGGARGDEKPFLVGMVMGAARRDFGNGDTLNLRVMLSPDPLMGKSGYPLLLAAGETADGRTPLVDRQHPHELVMELSAAYSHLLSEKDSVFVYAGLPGEPAFGPPAFMHRLSAMDSPEAPITHHWLDSTHVTFGVLTAGWVHDSWKIEASRFKGREPDQNRYDIEAPKLDSSAIRLSWNPGSNWSVQASWADLHSPEALEPDQDEHRWSASAIYTRVVGSDGFWSTTVAWGRKDRSDGVVSDGLALETALKPNADWTVIARAERQETDELGVHAGAVHGGLEAVSKTSLGVIRDWRAAMHAKIGVGALASVSVLPKALQPDYGQRPVGVMAFVRLVID